MESGYVISRHAIVEELAGLGATVHTCARNQDELNKCLMGWEDEGFGVTGSVCDVSNRVDRERLIDGVSSVFNGKLNILVSLNFIGIVHCFIVITKFIIWCVI